MRTFTPPSSRHLICLFVAGSLTIGIGATPESFGFDASGAAPDRHSQPSPPPTDDQLEEMFIAGPSALASLGLKTIWQANVAIPERTTAIALFATDGDSVFVMDSGFHFSRVLTRDGTTLWTTALGRSTDRCIGVNRVRYELDLRVEQPKGEDQLVSEHRFVRELLDEVLVLTDTKIIGVDVATGTIAHGHTVRRVPRTSGVTLGKHLIFGAKGGQVVWHQFPLGFFSFAGELGGTIDQSPILVATEPMTIVAASSNGTVACLRAGTSRQVWRTQLGGGIDHRIAVGADGIYVACQDHSITALELTTGNLRWRHMTNKPLVSDVFCDGSSVYLQVSGDGLVSLVANPKADGSGFARDGVVRWKCATASGNPICRVGSRILLWDSPAKTLTAVESTNGVVVAKVAMPEVAQMVITGTVDPEVYFIRADGALQRCASTTPAVTSANASTQADSRSADSNQP